MEICVCDKCGKRIPGDDDVAEDYEMAPVTVNVRIDGVTLTAEVMIDFRDPACNNEVHPDICDKCWTATIAALLKVWSKGWPKRAKRGKKKAK